MIRKEEVFKIGVINKPHGVKGEVSFTFTDDIFDRVDCDYLILLMDGILVPFFMEEYRFRSDNVALVKLGRRCASWLFRRDNRCGRYNDKRSFLY